MRGSRLRKVLSDRSPGLTPVVRKPLQPGPGPWVLRHAVNPSGHEEYSPKLFTKTYEPLEATIRTDCNGYLGPYSRIVSDENRTYSSTNAWQHREITPIPSYASQRLIPRYMCGILPPLRPVVHPLKTKKPFEIQTYLHREELYIRPATIAEEFMGVPIFSYFDITQAMETEIRVGHVRPTMPVHEFLGEGIYLPDRLRLVIVEQERRRGVLQFEIQPAEEMTFAAFSQELTNFYARYEGDKMPLAKFMDKYPSKVDPDEIAWTDASVWQPRENVKDPFERA